VLLSVVYATFRLLLDALLSRQHRDRDLELFVLRHQLNVPGDRGGSPAIASSSPPFRGSCPVPPGAHSSSHRPPAPEAESICAATADHVVP
jgi:hypothetical protein